MDSFWKSLGAELKARFITSWRTTLVGLLIDAGTVTLDVATNSKVTWLSAVGVSLGTILKLWKESRATPAVVGATLAALLFLTAGGAARADDTGALPIATGDPASNSTLGGCNLSGKVCWGPEISVSLVAIDTRTGKVEATFNPGLGYGIRLWPGTNHELGLGGYAAFKVSSDQNQAMFSGILSFNNYLRVGFSRVPIGAVQDNYLSFGFGSALSVL